MQCPRPLVLPLQLFVVVAAMRMAVLRSTRGLKERGVQLQQPMAVVMAAQNKGKADRIIMPNRTSKKTTILQPARPVILPAMLSRKRERKQRSNRRQRRDRGRSRNGSMDRRWRPSLPASMTAIAKPPRNPIAPSPSIGTARRSLRPNRQRPAVRATSLLTRSQFCWRRGSGLRTIHFLPVSALTEMRMTMVPARTRRCRATTWLLEVELRLKNLLGGNARPVRLSILTKRKFALVNLHAIDSARFLPVQKLRKGISTITCVQIIIIIPPSPGGGHVPFARP
mmetsp:Transcript_29873/g.87194  ORF Transcript_29873/g.87194 Transcript_29873/m.87194 type:complete len:282 (-) Transcript_29873:426-1271(-)